MFNATNTTKSLVAALVAVAALMAMPLAQASDGPPDAIDRFNNPAVVWDGPPDAIDRYLGRTTAPVATVDDSFSWSEFGIGAGAMLGAVLLLVGISLGALLVRHRGGELRTS